LRGDRRNAKSDTEFYGNFGVDFDDVAPDGKTFGGEIEAIDAEGEILNDEVSVRGNLEAALEVVAFAEEFTFGGKAGAFGIADFEMDFAAKALGARWDRRGEQEQACQQVQARDKRLEAIGVHF